MTLGVVSNPQVSPIPVSGRQPVLPWEYLTVSGYLVATVPTQQLAVRHFEGGLVDSAGTKTPLGTWNCPNSADATYYISGGTSPDSVVLYPKLVFSLFPYGVAGVSPANTTIRRGLSRQI